MKSIKTLSVPALAAILTACATQSAPVARAPQDLAETIASTPQLSTLSSMVNAAGLRDALKAPGAMTLFAPTNDAFAALPAKTRETLAANPEQLRALLTFHVLPSKVMAAEVTNSQVKSLNGAMLPLSKAGTIVTVDDAMVDKADIQATNGVIHTIDRVVIPPVVRR